MSEDRKNPTAVGLRFALLAGLLSVAFFGLLRVDWVEQNLLLPFTKFQETVACRIGGDPNSSVRVGLSCSGADVIALCLGFVMAFPVAWRKRLAGGLAGLALISVVNTVRIATLTHAVRDPFWFKALHIYIWPAVLVIVVALFVFLWMTASSGRSAWGGRDTSLGKQLLASPVARRFVPLTVLFVLIFIGSSDWLFHAAWLKTIATWITATSGWLLAAIGVDATVTGNMMRTANGGFVVTQECVATPLIPVYFAAVLSLSLTPLRRTLMLLLAFPVFFMLGAGRLLVLALPVRLIGSPEMAIHAFYQLLTAVLLIAGAAYLRGKGLPEGVGTTLRRASIAVLAAAAGGLALGPLYNKVVFGVTDGVLAIYGHAGHTHPDSQGALLLLPAYQLALLAGLWLASTELAPTWRRLGLASGVLILSHPLSLIALGELSSHIGLELHVAFIRALAVLTPPLLTWLLLRRQRAAGSAPAMALAEPQRG